MVPVPMVSQQAGCPVGELARVGGVSSAKSGEKAH